MLHANHITILRIVLSPVIIYLLFEHHYFLAFYGFVFASFLDWLDGYVARKLKQTSTLGTLLDPIADKALAVPMLLYFSWISLVPIWLSAIIAGRDFLISFIRIKKYLKHEFCEKAIKPSFYAKLKSAILFVSLSLYLLDLALNPEHCIFSLVTGSMVCRAAFVLLAISACLTLSSAFNYLKPKPQET